MSAVLSRAQSHGSPAGPRWKVQVTAILKKEVSIITYMATITCSLACHAGARKAVVFQCGQDAVAINRKLIRYISDVRVADLKVLLSYMEAIQAVKCSMLTDMSEADMFGLLVDFYMNQGKETHRGQREAGRTAEL